MTCDNPEDCEHLTEPGAMPLAHLDVIFAALQQQAREARMGWEQMVKMLDGVRQCIASERLILLAEDAARQAVHSTGSDGGL